MCGQAQCSVVSRVKDWRLRTVEHAASSQVMAEVVMQQFAVSEILLPACVNVCEAEVVKVT